MIEAITTVEVIQSSTSSVIYVEIFGCILMLVCTLYQINRLRLKRKKIKRPTENEKVEKNKDTVSWVITGVFFLLGLLLSFAQPI